MLISGSRLGCKVINNAGYIRQQGFCVSCSRSCMKLPVISDEILRRLLNADNPFWNQIREIWLERTVNGTMSIELMRWSCSQSRHREI